MKVTFGKDDQPNTQKLVINNQDTGLTVENDKDGVISPDLPWGVWRGENLLMSARTSRELRENVEVLFTVAARLNLEDEGRTMAKSKTLDNNAHFQCWRKALDAEGIGLQQWGDPSGSFYGFNLIGTHPDAPKTCVVVDQGIDGISVYFETRTVAIADDVVMLTGGEVQ